MLISTNYLQLTRIKKRINNEFNKKNLSIIYSEAEGEVYEGKFVILWMQT